MQQQGAQQLASGTQAAVGLSLQEWTDALKSHCRPLLEKLVLTGMLDSMATQGMLALRSCPHLRKDLSAEQWLAQQGVVLPQGISLDISEAMSAALDAKVQALVDEILAQPFWGDITKNFQQEIIDLLADGFAKGLSLTEIREALDRAAPKLARRKAERIATTEANAALNLGRIESMRDVARETGNLLGDMSWISMQDSRVRPSHVAANGQVRSLGEPFDISGHEALYPGDPALPPEERCGCRCGLVSVVGENF